MSEADLRDHLLLAGVAPEDLAWFEKIGWNPARVPQAEPDTLADYERRERLLVGTLEAKTFAERGESLAGRLAAAIGARIADLRDELRAEVEDDDEED